MGIAPSESSADAFGGVTPAVEFWSDDPAHFGHGQASGINQRDRRFKVAFILGEAEFADESSGPCNGVRERTGPVQVLPFFTGFRERMRQKH